jgi:hypothetical protein
MCKAPLQRCPHVCRACGADSSAALVLAGTLPWCAGLRSAWRCNVNCHAETKIHVPGLCCPAPPCLRSYRTYIALHRCIVGMHVPERTTAVPWPLVRWRRRRELQQLLVTKLQHRL